jgi:hypothetical protein
MKTEEDLELENRWQDTLTRIEQLIGKKPADMNAVLFLVGVQELGQGVRNFSKEQKQDLMHIAICKLLSTLGIYEFEGLDEQGWPHYTLVSKLPYVDLLSQEKLLKSLIIEYFQDIA